MQEQELFETYELKGWQFSKRLYQIIGVSVIVNLAFFVLMAQANFLTGKTCDSPIASGVCSVLDTLYVGGMILQTDAGYVDKPFEVTEIGDGDEITYINVGDYKPLTYPEGYFALANPDQFAALNDPTLVSSEIPGISTTPSDGGLMNTTPVLPPDTGAVLDKPLDDNPLGGVIQEKPKRSKNTSPRTLPKINGNPTKQEEQPIDVTKVKEVEINRQVMTTYANTVMKLVEKNEVDLNQKFKVIVEGPLTAEGKFDVSEDKKTKKSKTQFVEWEGDEQMVNLVKGAMQAVGDSGWLGYLKNLGAEKVKITFIQDDENFVAVVESEQKSANLAASMASSANLYITFKKPGIKEGDEKILFDGIQEPTSEGKVFKLNIIIPRPVAHEMINRRIKEAAEAEKNKQNSTAQTENANEKASER